MKTFLEFVDPETQITYEILREGSTLSLRTKYGSSKFPIVDPILNVIKHYKVGAKTLTTACYHLVTLYHLIEKYKDKFEELDELSKISQARDFIFSLSKKMLQSLTDQKQ